MTIAAWIIALFFAANIGASGTAASMGAAYGAGAVSRKWVALAMVAVGAFLGAILGGGSVVKTIGGGIVPSHFVTVEITLLILVSACTSLFVSNLIGIPLSTSEVTVGAVVGAGLAIGHLHVVKLVVIVSVWFVMPFVAMIIAFLLGKLVRLVEHRIPQKGRGVTRFLVVLLALAGCYEAFSAGMNNVANAIGPLVAAGIVPIHQGIYIGAGFVAIGALVLGGRVLDTNAKKITKLSLLQGSAVSLTSGTLVVIASLYGIPVPQTQATTMAIFGIGRAHVGRDIWRQDIVRRIIRIWIASPVSSLLISYILIQVVVFGHWTTLFIVVSAAFVGILYWQARPRKSETSTFREESI